MGLQGSLLLVQADHDTGLGAVPHDAAGPLDPLPPDDKLRLPKEEESVEANSSGELRGDDIAVSIELSMVT